YNAPANTYHTLPNEFIPYVTVTDANGDRLLVSRDNVPYRDVQSTLVQLPGYVYELHGAGPPGAIKTKGHYTYRFQRLHPDDPNARAARLTSIADDLGNTQTLSWNDPSAYLAVRDSSTSRMLRFQLGTDGYMGAVDTYETNQANCPIATHTHLAFD